MSGNANSFIRLIYYRPVPTRTFDPPAFPMDPDYPLRPSERFVDAALREHVRLGPQGQDEEMIHRILTATVHRKLTPVPRRRAEAPSLWDRRSVMVSAAAAAAIVTLGVWLLSSLSYSKRTVQEYQFVVRRVADPAAEGVVQGSSNPARVSARSLAPGGWTLHAPQSEAAPLADLSSAPVYEMIASYGPTPIESSLETLKKGRLRIVADRQVETAAGIRYEGRVEIEDAEYRIEAQQATLPDLRNLSEGMAATDGNGLDSSLLATEVRVTQIATGRTASAARLRYDLLEGTMELSGLLAFVDQNAPSPVWQRGDSLRITGPDYRIEARPVEASASFFAP